MLVCMELYTTLMVTNPGESAYFPKVMSTLLLLYWAEDIAYILMRYKSISIINVECSSRLQQFCVLYSIYTTLIKVFLSMRWKGIAYFTLHSWTGLLTGKQSWHAYVCWQSSSQQEDIRKTKRMVVSGKKVCAEEVASVVGRDFWFSPFSHWMASSHMTLFLVQ